MASPGIEIPRFETITPGIEVAEAVFSNQAGVIIEELKLVPEKYWTNLSDGNLSRLYLQVRNNELFEPAFDASEDLPTLGSIVTTSMFVASGRHNIIVNRQQPGYEQSWHSDKEKAVPPVHILHFSPNGRLDVRLQSIKGERVIPVNTSDGDVVKVTDSHLWHRGVNPSKEVRYNAVSFQPVPGDYI